MTTLNFSQHVSGTYRADLPVSTGDAVVVQLHRSTPGYVRILAHIGDMSPVRIALFGCYDTEFIQQIEQPKGVVLTIESQTQVIEGGYE